MAYSLTPYGYEVDGSLPPIVTVADFDAMTGDRYAGDPRVEHAIDAATAAIRAYCGWHVAPVLSCRIDMDGGRGDLWLPCVGLRSVDSVEFSGEAQRVVGFNRHGRVRTDATQPSGLGNVSVSYSAGFDASMTPDLANVIKERVVAEIARGTYGVASESAGGVSVSYGGTALSDAGGAFLPDGAKAALTAYRLVSAHVA